MDWNPLTWTFATTFFGISLLKWGLVVGGIIFLALVRKFLRASLMSAPRSANEIKTHALEANAETKIISSAAYRENDSSTPASAAIAQHKHENATPHVEKVKEFKQAVVVAKQKRKSPTKKNKIKAAKAAPKKIMSKKKTTASPVTAAAVPAPAIEFIPSPIPVMNAKAEAVSTTPAAALKSKPAPHAIAAPPKKVQAKESGIPQSTVTKPIIVKKKIKKKMIPAAVAVKPVPAATNTVRTAPVAAAKKESIPAKTEAAPRAMVQTNPALENKVVAKKKIMKKTITKKIVAKKSPEDLTSTQKVSAPESKSQPNKTMSEKSAAASAPATKPVRMRNPGFI
jgi:hypothetical protein